MSLKILLLENVHDTAAKELAAEGFEVIRKVKLEPEEYDAILPTVHAIGIRSKTKMPKEILAKAKNLLCIGCFCIGTDTTDLSAAAALGIPVFNSPYANTRSVAELIIAEMIMLARQAGDRSMEIHKGTWNKKSQGCYEVRGKTLGIIGYGHVGSQLSVLAEGLGMKVQFYDIQKVLALGNARLVQMDELLATSDFLTIHVPKLKSTENLVGRDQIKKMKVGSYLLNASRGNVVDVDAAAAALKSGHLAGGAFDVYPAEPKGYSEEFKSPLIGCPNTILTPHIGGSTEEAQEAIGAEVADKMIKYINTGRTVASVNVPNVDIGGPLPAGFTRVLNFHRDVPGVMRDINLILASGNITYQSLRTGNGIGYIIVDVQSSEYELIKDSLDKMDSTIRTILLHQGSGYRGVV